MGLRETFHRAAVTAFDAVGNVVEICTYHQRQYDPGTGQPSGEATVENLRVILQAFEIEKVDNSAVKSEDRQYLVAADELGGIEPMDDDWLSFPDGALFTIIRMEPDPARASYLQVGRNTPKEGARMAEGTVLEFQADLKTFSDAIGVTVEVGTKRVVLQVHNGVVEKTPVLTGRARGSWGISLDSPGTYVLPEGNYGIENAKDQQRNLEAYTAENPYREVWVFNNLAYIEALNMGHSKKAPAQFVELTLAEVAAEIDALLEAVAQETLPAE